MSFSPNIAAGAFERIDAATRHIFDEARISGIGRFALESGAVDVILGGFASVNPREDAATVVGLARHESGLVVYEHHVKKRRDTDDSFALSALAQADAPVVANIHNNWCLPNLTSACIKIDALRTEDRISTPRYRLDQEEPTHFKVMDTDAGRFGAARMIERFATEEYAGIFVGAEIQEALVVMGGAATVFKDPGMRAFAQAIAG
jgi:hypothetical protein